MKGEERVCHVTEADRPRGSAMPSRRSKASPVGRRKRLAPGLSEKCLHVRPLCAMGPRSLLSQGQVLRGLRPHRGGDGVLPLCAAVLRRLLVTSLLVTRDVGIKRKEGHLVDALALRGDEGRGTLRKARGRCERSLIPGSPNGATHPARGILR